MLKLIYGLIFIVYTTLYILLQSHQLMPTALINQIKQEVTSVYYDLPIVGQLALVQAIHESGLLQKPSSLAVKYNNFFGIKKAGTAGTVKLKTKEYIKGKWVIVYEPFGSNKTVADSITQHRALMHRPRYKSVLESKTFEEAAKAVWRSGYATDPSYPKKLINIYNKYIKKD